MLICKQQYNREVCIRVGQKTQIFSPRLIDCQIVYPNARRTTICCTCVLSSVSDCQSLHHVAEFLKLDFSIVVFVYLFEQLA